ncbi:SusC/RagA family TonB-linked outer membrane protein [Mangrovibacterium lignilyticum]|uniref:SusC/RagA family TonB-linked outer membrane protein n=1 Tax=Mangrovibacterium lignilyticum TaxID=2668052 RepID=UPI0013D477F3|nr:TonB-dependent receptor [Mangrovibacterium lignilyticum]
MKKTNELLSQKESLPNSLRIGLSNCLLVLIFALFSVSVFAQNSKQISGVVTDSQANPVIGATVMVKGTTIGTATDVDGKFTLNVPEDTRVLLVSFIGMEPKEVELKNKTSFKISLNDQTTELGETVVVGYGQQKKESIVGAIAQTTGDVLERSAGISNVGQALTGNLPGVVTISSTGMPGEEDPQILIRSASSWNNSEPLVLVDGVERPLGAVDIGSVESVSVLKDASATAVFGVKGANGVILITTKRGREGSAKIDVAMSATMKVPSKLPNKLDSYDALMARNYAIEHELDLTPESWAYITPQDIIEKYRYPANLEEAERYPNVDWQDALFKNFAMSYNASVNVSGGTKVVKYFAAADFVHEGDLFDIYDNGRGYQSGYGYNRLNVRSNLDFQLTKTTTLKVNLAGSNGAKKSPWNQTNSSDWAVAQQWAGAYNIAPDVFLPVYSDGSWGYYPNIVNVTNSAANLSLSGVMSTTTTRINTDFILDQKLDFITKGLSIRGTVSWDNVFVEYNRGVNDLYNDAQYKWIDPETGTEYYANDFDNNNKFDFMQGVLWTIEGGTMQNWATQRNLDYQVQLNWSRQFGKHDISAMGLGSRKERATGSVIPSYREDWAFRTTYNYASKYFLEYNGAYNGSEKFDTKYRFGFFNSGAIGWMISEENFMQNIGFLDMLKLRASYGEIGDDSGSRWLYLTQWAYANGAGASYMDLNATQSPYKWYTETSVGNPDVRWEKVSKLNVGADYAFFDGLLAGSAEYFRDVRTDILIAGGDRSVPSYFGTTPATANLGEVHTRGYELQVRINKRLSNSLRLWADLSMTHAVNEIINRDDPQLYADYQKQAGYSIGQTRSYVDAGYLNSYDALYGSPAYDANDANKLTGDYYIIDFNADGVVDSEDQVPYGYSSSPQNTYNATIGFEWKGFSAFAQFYGVNNVTRGVSLTSFGSMLNTVYDQGSWWSVDDLNADVTVPRYVSSTSGYSRGTQYLYDGSYVRLKNAEVAYTLTNGFVKRLGMSSLKLYLSGNNLWVWSKMPDDRESNFAGSSNTGAYPTMKRYSFGVRFTL